MPTEGHSKWLTISFIITFARKMENELRNEMEEAGSYSENSCYQQSEF